jgi:hypothetical protein
MTRSIKQQAIEILESNDKEFYFAIVAPHDNPNILDVEIGDNTRPGEPLRTYNFLNILIESLSYRRRKILAQLIKENKKNEKY